MPENMSKKYLFRLIPYMKPYWKKMGIVLIFMIFSSLLNLIPPLLMQIAIDDYIVPKNKNGLILLSLSFLAFGLALGFTGYFQKSVSQFVGNNIVRDLRNDVFTHVNSLSFAYFDKNRTGDLIARIISDTQRLQNFMSNGLINIISNFALLIGIIVVMFSWNIYFGLIILSLLPLLALGMYAFTTKVSPSNHRIRFANGVLSASIQECLDGIREVKLYGREEYVTKIFQQWSNEYRDAVIESNNISAFWNAFIPYILSFATGCVYLIGGLLVASDSMTVGFLMAAVAYFANLTRPIRMITRLLNILNRANASAERIFAILDTAPEIQDRPDALKLENVEGTIEFDHVHFGYSQRNEIISDLSLTIPAGKIFAFVGPSGVGKTTLLSLIPRFYEPLKGMIRIDGINLPDIQIKSLRSNVGIVMQNTFLFDGTIAENIAYGKKESILEDIQNAAKIAQLDEFISSLPLKYETRIGERGVRLSGGQAQRLAIARVIIMNPKILILDEPTAQVDAITDHNLMHAVRQIMQNRTTLVIAHRLWTVKNADCIVVLRDGKLEAMGLHQELLKTSDFYTTFFATQFQKHTQNNQQEEDEK